ncbi:MAG TPA: hypothetical protein VGK16_06915 [Candidatus Limnocylindrales bacterium]|jgi:hypothetical protein
MQSLAAQVLAAWQHAEQLTQTLAPESPEYAVAARACADLRSLLQDLGDAGMVSLVDDEATVESADPDRDKD